MCLGFARAGANVAFTYRSNARAAEETRALVEALGVECISQQAETSDEHSHHALIERMVAGWGSLDVAISNAGIWKGACIDSMSIEEYREMMEINMTGSFVMSKHAAIAMKRQQSGSILIVSSTAGQRGEAEHSHYAASKGAQISFTKSLATELAPFGVRVNCIAPGWVSTEMTAGTLGDPAAMARVLQAIPLERVARPEEIANAALFLASPLASFITGEVLNVNGGAVLCG
jgi:3-oxoacyl-[acyl-carrier protein] reductase